MKLADIEVGKAYAKGSPASFTSNYPQASYVIVLDASGKYYNDSWYRGRQEPVSIPPLPWNGEDGNPIGAAVDYTRESTHGTKGVLKCVVASVSERYVWDEETGRRDREKRETVVQFVCITTVKASQLRMPWDEFEVLKAEKEAERKEEDKAERAAEARAKAEKKAKAEQRRSDLEYLNKVLADDTEALLALGRVAHRG